MRSLVMILAMLLVAPVAASAQHGVIGLYSDQAGTNCEMVDAGQGQLNIYVVHTQVVGSIAVEFMVQPSVGFTATHIGDSTPFLFIGNSQTGISLGYGDCLSGPINVMTVTYQFDGTSSACGFIEVVGDPAAVAPGLYSVDCGVEGVYDKHIAQGGRLFVNADGSCPCLSPVPAQESTWGQIKAIYN